ncbi:nucleolar RNA helicase 2-like isoform X1 [Huso huso]|uniref:RNA helicase n=1 Tax=Huso huso TaxID=61971 RepID=A0ABR0ZAV7_HUSHU
MPGKIRFDSDEMEMEDSLDSVTVEKKKHKKHKKEKKSKNEEKPKKKKQAAEEEQPDDECDPPTPKKKKKDRETSNGESGKKERPQETNGSISNGTPLMKSPQASEESNAESDIEKEKEIIPELTPEQKEGAFSNFRISKETINLLKGRGVTYLFDIQSRTFNSVYDGKDVVAQARTGTGKTFSFAIPLIEKLQSDPVERKKGRSPKVLVLTPTRELGIQVSRDFKDVTRKLSVACFYGGTAYNGQFDSIRNGIDVLVGTPGRIKDHLQNNKLDLSKVKHVVLDEVDQMLDMGFAEQVEEILGASYKKDSEDNPQTLLFSATCPHWVYDVAKKYMRPKYEQVDLIGKKTQKAATTVEHLAVSCHWSQRAAVIGDVVRVYSGSHGRTIVFCETKKEANELAMNASIKQDTQCLHGDIPQKQREVTLKGFRNGSFEVLVATNVAARGLDIPEVDLVVQCSPPKDVESYIHRSGRTGRAGRPGVCICFFQRREEEQLRFVEQRAGITFRRVGVPTATDIIKASSKDAVRFLDSVPATAIEYFRVAAEKLVEERGAVEALAAALAHISGATAIEQRSLLNSDAGYVTMTCTCSVEMHNIGYAWKALKEQLGEEVDQKVQRMNFLKGKTGVCFDVPADCVKEYQEKWSDSRRWQLSVAAELPEREAVMREGGSSFGRKPFGGGRGGGRGFNRNDRFNNNHRGQKRSFGRAFDY